MQLNTVAEGSITKGWGLWGNGQLRWVVALYDYVKKNCCPQSRWTVPLRYGFLYN